MLVHVTPATSFSSNAQEQSYSSKTSATPTKETNVIMAVRHSRGGREKIAIILAIYPAGLMSSAHALTFIYYITVR
jgi:hypothetical protein